MKILGFVRRSFFILPFLFISLLSFCDAPRLTVIFVVDQFAYSYINKLKPFFKGGLKLFLDEGVVYENAYYPHAMPATATGHAALATGVFAKNHGVIGNKWYNPDGKMVTFPTDSKKNAAVFDRDGNPLNYGRSSHRVMVPGLSDQLILHPYSQATNHSFAISIKDRSAIAMAGSLGKAIWFDDSQGCFTTSKAYFGEVPGWVSEFNKKKKIWDMKRYKWNTAYYLKNNPAYAFKNIDNYKYVAGHKRIAGTEIELLSNDKESGEYNGDGAYEKFCYLPIANRMLLDLAESCIDTILKKAKRQDKIMVWISLSSLDKLSHLFGPDSLEAIDMVYHIDKLLRRFMRRLHKRIRKKDVLFALTADHGTDPIPELLQDDGFKKAIRIDTTAFVKKMNRMLTNDYGVDNFVAGFKSPQFFFDHRIFDDLKPDVKQRIISGFKEFLLKQPGIKNVWTYDELKKADFASQSIESFYKNQLYPGRSGYLSVQVYPYCQASKYKTGTGHRNPYEAVTHVPLMFYRKGEVEKKIVRDRVNMLQFANTIAQMLEIPRLPASVFNILPGLSFQAARSDEALALG